MCGLRAEAGCCAAGCVQHFACAQRFHAAFSLLEKQLPETPTHTGRLCRCVWEICSSRNLMLSQLRDWYQFSESKKFCCQSNTIVTSQDESLSGLKKTAEYTLQKDCQKLSFCTLLRALYRFPSVWRWSSASVDRSFLDSLMHQENPSEWIFMIQCEVKII